MCANGGRLICVTQRSACPDDFLARLKAIAGMRPARIILREKDLSPQEYLELARQVSSLCRAQGVPLTLNGPAGVFLPGCGAQLSFARWEKAPAGIGFGVSVHSPEEAAALHNSRTEYLIAGHIYPTACKEGVPPRGIAFLTSVVQAAAQPVYAIGGIAPCRVPEILRTGAAGYCVMSGLMTAPDPQKLIWEFYEMEHQA